MASELTTLARLKAVLGVSSTDSSQDDLLQLYVDSANEAVEVYCGRTFASADYVQYYTGNNTYRLVLRQRPVTAVSEVRFDGSGYFGQRDGGFDSTTVLTEGVDYCLDWDSGANYSKSGILFRIGTIWPMLHRQIYYTRLSPDIGPALGNLKVSYTAGYPTIPADLSLAATQVAAHMKRVSALGGYNLQSERIGDYRYEMFTKLLVNNEVGGVLATLARYKDIGW